MNDGGAAFPSQREYIECRGEWNQTHDSGMTLLDWFAGQALAGIIEYGVSAFDSQEPVKRGELTAQWAYDYAQAMLAERERLTKEAK